MYIERRKLSTDFLVSTLSKTLEDNHLKKMNVKNLVCTPVMGDLKLLKSEQLICGLRGVGKSTAVHMAMESKKGVVHVALSPCRLENFYSSILETLRFRHSNIEDKVLIRQTLEEI